MARRRYYRTFERASGQKIEVAYTARYWPSFMEIDVLEARDERTGKLVEMSPHESDDYAEFIAEHHMDWHDWQMPY